MDRKHDWIVINFSMSQLFSFHEISEAVAEMMQDVSVCSVSQCLNLLDLTVHSIYINPLDLHCDVYFLSFSGQLVN